MADTREGGPRGGSGTDGGTDVEPLRGGMREVDAGRLGPEHDRDRAVREGEASPPAPYHDVDVPHPDGLAAGATPTRRPPPVLRPDQIDRDAGGKVAQERGDHENEAGNAPRHEPGSAGT